MNRNFKVNLQQGFLLDNLGNIAAAYSHHNNVIYLKIPYAATDIEIPKEMATYKVVKGLTDSFSITMYTVQCEKSV